jgi:Sec-independent protein translocase protein TatA
MPEWAIGVVIIVVAVGMAQRLAGHVGRGGGRFKRSKSEDDLERRLADLEDSQRQLAAGSGETAELERRMGELEERLDFAERMLARRNDAERLGPPKA